MVFVWSEDFEALSTNRLVKVNTERVIALVIGLQPKGRTVLAYDCPNQPDNPTTWTEAWTRWLDWMQSIGNQLHVRRSNDAQLTAIMGAHAGLQFSWRYKLLKGVDNPSEEEMFFASTLRCFGPSFLCLMISWMTLTLDVASLVGLECLRIGWLHCC